MSAQEAIADAPDARPLLAIWAGVLALGGLLALGAYLALNGYVEHLRMASPWTYLKAAERFESENNFARAIDMLNEAARRAPSSAVPHERAGLILYTHRKDWAGALAAFDHALERGTDSLDVRGKKMWALMHLGRHDEAADFGRACIAEGQTSPNFPRYTAEALFRGGHFEAAAPYFETALRSFPKDLLLLERLRDCYRNADQPEKAAAIEQRIRESEG